MEREEGQGAGEVPMRRAWRERGQALLQLEQVRKEAHRRVSPFKFSKIVQIESCHVRYVIQKENHAMRGRSIQGSIYCQNHGL